RGFWPHVSFRGAHPLAKWHAMDRLHRISSRRRVALFHHQLWDGVRWFLDFGNLGTAFSFRAVFRVHRRYLFPAGRAASDRSENLHGVALSLSHFLPDTDISWKVKFTSNYRRIMYTDFLDFCDLSRRETGMEERDGGLQCSRKLII